MEHLLSNNLEINTAQTPGYLLPFGSEEREVTGTGSIPVAILPSC